jgi:hypothetical protein
MIKAISLGFKSLGSAPIPSRVLGFLILISILPIMLTDISGDDIPNSEIRNTLQSQNVGLLKFITSGIRQWIVNEGRFYPGSFFWQYSSFYFFNGNLIVYKIFLAFLFLLTCIALSNFLISILNLPKQFSLYITFLLVSTYQIQQSTSMAFDGITGFAGLPQIGILFFVLAYFVLTKYDNFWLKICAGLIFYTSFTTYESIYLFLTSFVFYAIYKLPKNKKFFLITPFLLQFITIILLRYVFFPNHSEAYIVSLNLKKLIPAYFSNIYSSLPGYRLFNFYNDSLTSFGIILIIVLTILASIYGCLICVQIIKTSSFNLSRKKEIIFLILCASLSFVFAPIGSSVSKRWQNTTPDYHSYISVVYQYLSLGIILALVSIFLCTKQNRFQILFNVISSIIFTLNLYQNYIALEILSN